MANARQFMAARTGAWAKSGGSPYGGLRFTAEADNSSVQLTAVGSAPKVKLVKSFDGINWEDYSVGEVIDLPSIGKSVYLAAGEGGNSTFCSSPPDCHNFVINGLVSASGDITSLIRFDLVQKVIDMFCYFNMFSGCTGLMSAPELPATKLESGCYGNMFSGCTGLSIIKVNFAAWRQETNGWVSNVAPTGTFYKPSALPEEYGTGKIPTGWTVVNID